MMSRKTFFLLLYTFGIGVVISLFLAVVLLFDGRTVYAWFEKALAPSPTRSSPTAEPTQIALTPTITPTPSPTLTPTPVPYCGGPPSMMLVLIGIDSRADSYYAGLADSIRLVRVDFVNPGIMILPFQRDIYVEIPGLEQYGITHGKLNQGYTYGTPAFGYYDAPNLGLGLMADTMQHNFGVHVDNGIAINMYSFVRIIDALGGIDIYLPETIDGRVPGSRDSDLYFQAGNLHLDGWRALLLARLRPEGDFQRTGSQTIILKALSAKLLSPAILPRIPELVSAFQDSVFTDLSTVQVAQLTCLATLIDPQKIRYLYFPEDLFQGTRVQDPVLGNTFVWDVDFNVLRHYVAYFKEGTWPAAP